MFMIIYDYIKRKDVNVNKLITKMLKMFCLEGEKKEWFEYK